MKVRAQRRRAIAAATRGWALILPLALAGGTAAYVGSGAVEPVYEATTTMLVGDLGDATAVTKRDVETSRTLASMYGTLIRRRPVLERVADDLDLPGTWLDLRDRVFVDAGTNDSPVIVVTAFAETSDLARSIADAIAARAIELISAGGAEQGAGDELAFATRQAQHALRRLDAAEARVSSLQAALAAAPTEPARARIRSRIEEQTARMSAWQSVYASLQRARPDAGSPNALHVLEPAEPSEVRVRPRVPATVALGAVVGMALGLGLWQGRRSRRARRGIPSGPAEKRRPSAAEDVGRGMMSPSGDDGMRLDPWLRELVASGDR